MSPAVVLPSVALRDSAARTALSSVIVCADPERADALSATLASLGSGPRTITSGAQLRDYAGRHGSPDVCVIVTPLPDGPVLPLLRMLRSRGWQRLVVLSRRADARSVHAAHSSGVRSVLVRPAQQTRPIRTRPGDPAKLSDRELEVLRMVAGGQTNRQVGDRLGLSALTVKSHLARIARKLGSGDRAHMVATAIRCGYIH